MYNFIYICTRTSMYTMIDNVYIYIWVRTPDPWPPPMVWSPKLTLSGTRDTGHGTIHTYIRTYVRTYVHTYIQTHTDIHTYLPTYLPTCLHTYIPTYLRTYVHTYIHTYMHACMHGCIHTYIPTYIPTYQHTNRTIPPSQATGGGPWVRGGGLGVLGHIYIYIWYTDVEHTIAGHLFIHGSNFTAGENGDACVYCHLPHPEKTPKLDKRQRTIVQGTRLNRCLLVEPSGWWWGWDWSVTAKDYDM